MKNRDFFTIISQMNVNIHSKQTIGLCLQLDTFLNFLLFFLHFALICENHALLLQGD
jgi:hypothetical protein